MAHTYTVQEALVTGGILHLSLEPAQASDRLNFAPGQYASIGFMRDGRPTPVRCFSIVSSPDDPQLRFAIRIHGSFTKAAARLRPGDTVWVEGPFGEFMLDPEQDQAAVFLAGGIGITPFMSMLRFATENNLELPITLIYSNRSADSIPFFAELLNLASKNPWLRISFFISDGRTTARSFRNAQVIPGGITSEHIRQLTVGGGRGSTYFICGPSGFTKAIKKGLSANATSEDQIVTESFTQATSLASANGRLSIRSIIYGLSAAALVGAVALIVLLNFNSSSIKTAAAQSQAVTQDTTTTSTSPTPASAPVRHAYRAPVSSVS